MLYKKMHEDKTTAALLAFFLGGIGFHHFYLGNTNRGILYLIFCWTFIPAIIAFVESIQLFFQSQYEFDNRYNKNISFYRPIENENARSVADEVEKLYNLKQKRIISDEEFELMKKKLL